MVGNGFSGAIAEVPCPTLNATSAVRPIAHARKAPILSHYFLALFSFLSFLFFTRCELVWRVAPKPTCGRVWYIVCDFDLWKRTVLVLEQQRRIQINYISKSNFAFDFVFTCCHWGYAPWALGRLGKGLPRCSHLLYHHEIWLVLLSER